MKVTIVPAQVTTVEDRVAGNLGLTQLTLLAMPIFGGGILYIVMPPFFHAAIYKLLVIAALTIVCSLLAIRWNDRLLLLWLVILIRYHLRPQFYVYDKRSLQGRELTPAEPLTEIGEESLPKAKRKSVRPLSPAELTALHRIINDPLNTLSFEISKKGGLYAHVPKVKPEV